MRRVLVALVVLLAGCPGAGEFQDSTTTVTPAPVPEDVTYPPGIGPSGVVDPATLGETHAAILADTSYTIVSNRTISGPNGSLRSSLDVRVALAADRSYHARAATAGPEGPVFMGLPPARGEYWSNGTVYVSLLERGDGWTASRFTPPNAFAGTWRYWRSTVAFGGGASFSLETLRSLFDSIPTTLVGTRAIDGTTLYLLAGDSAVSADFAKAGTGRVSNVSFRAVVTEAGVVRSFDLSYQRQAGSDPIAVDWHLRYEDVGSTKVDPPAWVGAAISQDSPVTVTSTPSYASSMAAPRMESGW